MDSFVGVKNITTYPLSKQDLILFDRIIVSDLSASLLVAEGSRRAELEWLSEQGMISDAESVFAAGEYVARTDPFTPGVFHIFVVIGSNARLLSPRVGLEPDDIFMIATLAAAILKNRLVASYTESVHGIRTVPLLNSDFSGFDVFATLDRFLPAVRELLDEARSGRTRLLITDNLEIDPQIQSAFAEDVAAHLQRVTDGKHAAVGAESPVIDIVLRSLPIPDESVPWEKIRDFRRDEASRLSLLDLRAWMRKLATRGATPVEIREEFEHLRADYLYHMKLHEMKTRPGWLRALLSVPAALGKLAKLDIEGAAEPLLKMEDRRVLLLEKERTAPGREVAYIVKAGDAFASRT
jgi:hypothetical protein